MHAFRRRIPTLTMLCLAACLPVTMASRPIDNPRYDLTTTKGPDSKAGGWLINLGITGIRARLNEDAPKQLVVGYVFPDSPASDLIRPGDVITGVDGQDSFATAHTFGYGMDKFGYEGPLMEFAHARGCQGTDGTGQRRCPLQMDACREDP